ncbi:MAG: acyltransferase family protein [Steroidobacterales bacterium]
MSFPGWVATVPCFGTALALLAGAQSADRGAARVLAIAPMQVLGKLSYSWYLWHWPFIVYTEALLPNVSAIGKTVAGLGALAASALTYRLLENPVRFNPALVRRPALTVGFGAAITVASLAVATVTGSFSVRLGERPEMQAITSAIDDTGRLPRRDCVSSPDTTEVTICRFGTTASATQLVLFGDSHAMQWFNPLEQIARRRSWALVTFVKSGCPSVDLRPPSHSALALANCREWQKEAMERVIALRPTVVFLANATAHFGTASHVPSHVEYDETFADLEAGTRRTLTQLSAAGIPVVLMRDIPRLGFDVPTCLARSIRHSWYPGGGCPLDKSRAVVPAVFESERAAASGLPDVFFIDLIDHLCDAKMCPTRRGDLIMYRDNHHITATYAESFAAEIETALLADVAALRGSP